MRGGRRGEREDWEMWVQDREVRRTQSHVSEGHWLSTLSKMAGCGRLPGRKEPEVI